jgi:nucleotide-binding universal stress UspA family protein
VLCATVEEEGRVRVVLAVHPAKPSGWIEPTLSGFPFAGPLDIVVVCALEAPPPPRTSPGPAARRLYGAAIGAMRAQAEDAARRRAAAVRAHLGAGAASVAVRVGHGPAPAAIVQAATAWRADLILTGPSGSGALRRALLGSVPEEVVRAAPCPVLLAKRGLPDCRRLLAATDGSLHAEAALRFLAALPLPASAQVRLSAVSETLADGWVAALAARRRDARAAEVEQRTASRAIARAHAILGGLRCSVQSSVRAGQAVPELAHEIAAWTPDLLVLGARGRTAGPDMPLGSVTAALLRATSCPALVFRG